jgi:hypothetical protein
MPLIIGVLTITTVLLGGVYERKREIGTLASLGLSPLHVSLMFLGESSIYAVMGSALGYVLGLFFNGIVIGLNLLPVEVAPNVASSWLIMAIGLSIAAAYAATLYPMFQASRLVTPSLERRWKIPTKPKGDEWEIPFPFVFQNREIQGILAFSFEFFQAHTTEKSGSFWVRDLKITKEGETGTSLEMIARIAPYEANIEQEVKILLLEKKGGERNTVLLHIRRIYGILSVWKMSNRSFIDAIRKQLLMWRSIPPAERERYIEIASRTFLNKLSS